VFGGGGQVGCHLIELASATGRDLVGLTHAEADICDADAVAAAIAKHSPTSIVNAAAYTAVDEAESEAMRAFAINRDGASVVAEAAAKADIPLIHLSTDYVFDGASRVPYREDDNVNPQGSYATSKEAGERAVRGSHDRHLILRTAWVYGPFGTNFVKTMLRLGAEREELRVVDDQTGCPTSTEDLAGAILTLAESLEGPGFSGWGHLPLCRRRPDHLVRLRHHDLCRSGKARTQSPASPPDRDRRLSDGRAPACLFGARHGKA
jgi:dTDP-4-dehydrorhamnose reductase